MLRKACLLLLVLVLIPCISHAEPTSAIQYLINEPTSLLDYGQHKLEIHLQAVGEGDQYVMPFVNYDVDSNRIIILVHNTAYDRFKNKIDAKNWCDEIICDLRKRLAIDCSSLKPLFLKKNSLISHFFSHDGYKRDYEPKNLGSELDKIVIFRIGAYWGKNKDSNKSLICEVPLLGSEIMCSD